MYFDLQKPTPYIRYPENDVFKSVTSKSIPITFDASNDDVFPFTSQQIM